MSSFLKILFMTHDSQNEILLWYLYRPPSRLRLRESNVASYVCLFTRGEVHVQDPASSPPLFWPLALPPVTFSNLIILKFTVLGPVPQTCSNLFTMKRVNKRAFGIQLKCLVVIEVSLK